MTIEEGFPQHGVGAEIWLPSLHNLGISLNLIVCPLLYLFHCYAHFFSASILEESFEHLDAPVERIAVADVPMPYAANLERMAVPQVWFSLLVFLLFLYSFFPAYMFVALYSSCAFMLTVMVGKINCFFFCIVPFLMTT